MARPRKNVTPPAASLAERLRSALVPEEEQPYPVPANWCWVRLGGVYQINPKNSVDDDTLASFVPMGKIDAGMKGTFTFDVQPWGIAKKGHTQFADGDVAFAKISPCFENGKSMLINGLKNGIGCGTTELVIIRQPEILQKYTFYIISDDRFIKEGVKTYSGTVGQQRISMEFVHNHPIPLPPLAEQQRIVERVEALFAKLDEARAKLEEIRDGHETRRAAILHKAFTGELTAKWREAHGVGLESWEERSIKSLCNSLTYGTAKKSEKTGKVAVLRMGNLQSGEIDWTDIVYTNDEEDIKKYSLRPGDVLFNRTNSAELVGKTSIYRGEMPAIYAGYLIKIDYNRNVIGDYLNYILNSPKSKMYCNSVKLDGVNQSNINAAKMGAFVIPVPSVVEQREIVRLLDTLLAREDLVHQAATQALEHIDLMKKAILARAFRGELGTNVAGERGMMGEG